MTKKHRMSSTATIVTVAALATIAWLASSAHADTSFGGNPNGTASGLTCADGTPPPFQVGVGSSSCTWSWLGASQTDFVPFGPTGGTGTLTSVTIPALPQPGPMQVDVLTSTAFINSAGKAEAACCSVKEISATFTVPANQVTTVPLALPVSSTPNVYNPGETQKSDELAISVLDGTSTVPIRYTQDQRDLDRAAFPAITSTTQEIRPLTDASEVEVMASFTYAPTAGPPAPTPVAPAPTPTPAPAPAPTAPPAASPLGGLALIGRPLTPNASGRTVVLGKATNPPTASTVQTLTGLLPTTTGRAARGATAKGSKPIVLGRGKTTVPSGKSAALAITLTGAARHVLASGRKLMATERIVATGPGGTKTTTKVVHLDPRKR